jgi:capsular polysaccharide biosynthesis protein
LSNVKNPPYFDLIYELFECIGVDPGNLIEIKEATQFRTVIVPEQAYELNTNYHNKYRELIDFAKGYVPAAEYRKVYFAKLPSRSIGENLAVDLYKSNGFSIFAPECLGTKEMISILNECEEFAASSGSKLITLFFLMMA